MRTRSGVKLATEFHICMPTHTSHSPHSPHTHHPHHTLTTLTTPTTLYTLTPAQIDEFPVNEDVALQLAGLQAQVLWGNFDPALSSRYNEVEQYLHPRIISSNKSKTREDWKKSIAEAHKVCGCGGAYGWGKGSSLPFFNHPLPSHLPHRNMAPGRVRSRQRCGT